MSNLTDFFPSGGGGGLTPKFQEFNATGFFTPSQALIDAGGYIEVFLVGGGGTGDVVNGANGGEVLMKTMYLTIAQNNGVTVIIGSGATTAGSGGGDSQFAASFGAGGVDLIAAGGGSTPVQVNKMGSGWGSYNNTQAAAGSGTLGYGAGGVGQNTNCGGIYIGKANSGQAGQATQNGGSGYCLIKWYE
tara:strand:- start:15 stop:581 length:567 start_codon:yes stop_codon:yes gene_type:complete